MSTRVFASVVFAACCCPGPAAAGILLVGPAGFTDFQAALDAALPGDVVLVTPGTFMGHFTLAGKAVTIQAAVAGTAILASPCAPNHLPVLDVSAIPAGGTVLIAGIEFASCINVAGPGVRVRSSAGLVRFERCVVDRGWPALLVEQSRVSLAECSARGLDIHMGDVPGGDGLAGVESTIVIEDSTLIGGKAAPAPLTAPLASEGGAGARLSASSILLAGSTSQGGAGGGDVVFGGAVGAGLRLLDASLCVRLDSILQGGPGGMAAFGQPGPDGPAVELGGSSALVEKPGIAREIFTSSPMLEGGVAQLLYHGASGDVCAVFASTEATQVILPLYAGALGAAAPVLVATALASGDGSAALAAAIPALPAGLPVLQLYLQVGVQGLLGAQFLSETKSLLVFPN